MHICRCMPRAQKKHIAHIYIKVTAIQTDHPRGILHVRIFVYTFFQVYNENTKNSAALKSHTAHN